MYDLLEISYPIRLVKDKEMYLCNRIALRNYKFFLGKKKKYVLAEKYIALKYLDKIDSDFFNNLKDKIPTDIRNISIFRRDFIEILPFKLNDVYRVYNEIDKFKNLINEFQNLNLEKIDQKVAEETLKRMSFIFDANKKTNPITYVGFYLMQYVFWQLVVVGGILTNMNLSAKLLSKTI